MNGAEIVKTNLFTYTWEETWLSEKKLILLLSNTKVLLHI